MLIIFGIAHKCYTSLFPMGPHNITRGQKAEMILFVAIVIIIVTLSS